MWDHTSTFVVQLHRSETHTCWSVHLYLHVFVPVNMFCVVHNVVVCEHTVVTVHIVLLLLPTCLLVEVLSSLLPDTVVDTLGSVKLTKPFK